MTDLYSQTGVDIYVNDEPGDPNPGVMIDAREHRGRALTANQARALGRQMIAAADYFDELNMRAAAQAAVDAGRGDSNDAEIEALQEALNMALNRLGLTMPDPTEED